MIENNKPSLKSSARQARLGRIWVVFLKEMRETMRDHRVLFGVIVSPLLITPLLLGGMGFFISKKQAEVKAEKLSVAVVGADYVPDLITILKEDATLTVISLPSLSEAEQQVKKHTQRAAFVIPESAKSGLASGQKVELELLYDLSNEKSRTAKSRLEDGLKKFNEQVVVARLKARSLDAGILKPTEAKSRSLAEDSSVGMLILSLILPYTIVLTGALGGMTSAFDICAGEKERGTMETLLVSPVSRTEIILGKILTITSVSMLATLCAIAGLVFSFQSGIKAFEEFTRGKIAVSYSAIGVMIVMMVPLVLFTSVLLLVISSFARNQKEAQAYVLPFMVLLIVPAMLTMVLGEESPLSMSLVPILNTALVLKQVLLSLIKPDFIALTFGSSLLYSVIALVVVVALFNREEILFRS